MSSDATHGGTGGPWHREAEHMQHDLMKVNLLAKMRPSRLTQPVCIDVIMTAKTLIPL